MTENRAAGTDGRAHGGIVCLLIGEEQFAMRTEGVRLVARAEEMREDPAGDRLGTIVHGNRKVPVYCLAALLGRPSAAATDGRHVVVTGSSRDTYGLLLDRVVRSTRLERFSMLRLPSIVGPLATRRFDGLVQAGEVSCLALAPASLDPGAAFAPASIVSRTLRRTPAATDTATEMAVIFSSPALPRCSERRYALGARQIAAVVQMMSPVSVPGAPSFVTAVAPWRGQAVAMVDFTGLGNSSTGVVGRSLVVRTRDGGLIGFPVDADLIVHRVTADDALVAPGGKDFVKGVFAAGSERVALLDIDALLGAGQHARGTVCAA